MRFKRIKPPKFYIDRNVLNEYELLQIMAEVAQGSRDGGIIVKDENGHQTVIRDDGRLVGNLARFNMQAHFHSDILYGTDEREKDKRKKKKVEPIYPPVFYWDDLVLNEYETRKLQVDVAEGKRKPNKVRISDEHGNHFLITEDGTFRRVNGGGGAPHGYGLASSFTLELIRIRREKAKSDPKL